MRLESRDGAEYEFTTVLDIVHDGHFAVASKDRTGIFGSDPKPITVDTGKRLADWLAGGHALPSPDEALIASVNETIDAAGNGEFLDRVAARIDALVDAGRITTRQQRELTTRIDLKREQLVPALPAAAN
jgi:hypothetical protein